MHKSFERLSASRIPTFKSRTCQSNAHENAIACHPLKLVAINISGPELTYVIILTVRSRDLAFPDHRMVAQRFLIIVFIFNFAADGFSFWR
jgi:hypothetical protein